MRLLPDTMDGLTALELGCGTGYVSGWMAKRGARVTGIDLSSEQLATARRLAALHDTAIDFKLGNAESVEVPDRSVDFIISEYGASIWCDPDLWLREAWRILRPGGEVVFLGDHPLAIACRPVEDGPVDMQLRRPYWHMRIIDWTQAPDAGGIEFNRSVSDWIDLITTIGFCVCAYREVYAPPNAVGERFNVPADWAKTYPCEQVWKLSRPW